jgi:hypothetical protein
LAGQVFAWFSMRAMQTFFRTLLTVLLLALPGVVQAGSVMLAWDPSVSTDVAGYHVYWGGASGTYTNVVDALRYTNVVDAPRFTQATISGLTEGATYFFAATAYDSSGRESGFSNEVNYTLPAVSSTLPPPRTSHGRLGVLANGFGFTLTGTSNQVILVEACTNLANPTWFPVGTNTLTGGSSYFSDPQWTNYPARFYRIR